MQKDLELAALCCDHGLNRSNGNTKAKTGA